MADDLLITRQTPEQLQAIEAQTREGFWQRMESRWADFKASLATLTEQHDVERARADALEQKIKGLETGRVEKVREMLSQREQHLVLSVTEIRDQLAALTLRVEDLVTRINAAAPGFLPSLPLPPPAAGVPPFPPPTPFDPAPFPVVPAHVVVEPVLPAPVAAETLRREREVREQAKAEQERRARETSEPEAC